MAALYNDAPVRFYEVAVAYLVRETNIEPFAAMYGTHECNTESH